MNRPLYGFSLIELLITLAIISILASIAYPLYSQQITKTRRKQASIALMKLANELEQQHSLTGHYANAQSINLKTLEKGLVYRLSIQSESPNQFKIAATPLKHQAKQDQSCGTLILLSNGRRQITGNAEASQCWQ